MIGVPGMEKSIVFSSSIFRRLFASNGASRRRILGRHLLPNLVSPIVVAATLGVAHVIVLEAGLSYLGIGVPQPLASWGNIIQDGADQIATLWWMALFPGLFMVLTVMTLNILGEALRDAYDRR